MHKFTQVGKKYVGPETPRIPISMENPDPTRKQFNIENIFEFVTWKSLKGNNHVRVGRSDLLEGFT